MAYTMRGGGMKVYRMCVLTERVAFSTSADRSAGSNTRNVLACLHVPKGIDGDRVIRRSLPQRWREHIYREMFTVKCSPYSSKNRRSVPGTTPRGNDSASVGTFVRADCFCCSWCLWVVMLALLPSFPPGESFVSNFKQSIVA